MRRQGLRDYLLNMKARNLMTMNIALAIALCISNISYGNVVRSIPETKRIHTATCSPLTHHEMSGPIAGMWKAKYFYSEEDPLSGNFIIALDGRVSFFSRECFFAELFSMFFHHIEGEDYLVTLYNSSCQIEASKLVNLTHTGDTFRTVVGPAYIYERLYFTNSLLFMKC